MYKLLIERYPEHLITEDEWGDLPLLYALWGRAPQEIVDYLTSSMKRYHPNYNVDWYKMMQTFCKALAPTACVEYLIETNRKAFPEQRSELQSIDLEQMVGTMCISGKATEEHVHRFIDTYKAAFPERTTNQNHGFLRLILQEKFGFKPFWLKIGISQRLLSLQKQEMREELERIIRECPTGSSERTRQKRAEVMVRMLNRLDLYEIIEKMWVLELALWKMKIEQSEGANDKQDGGYRQQCHITTGADVIVPNVMPYLRHEYNFSVCLR